MVVENVEIEGKMFVHTYSDKGFYIERDGALYEEAYDPVGTNREYVETDKLIEVE